MKSKFALAAVLLAVLAFAIDADAKVLCAKKKLAVKKSSVAHGASLLVVDGAACPKGYALVLDTVSFAGAAGAAGPAGATGATGATGPTINDATIYIAGAAGVGFQDITTSDLMVDPSSYGNVQLTDRNAAGSTLYYYIPIPITVFATGTPLVVKQMTVNYRLENAASYITEVSLEKVMPDAASTQLLVSTDNLISTTAAAETYTVPASTDNVLDAPVMARFALDFANNTQTIYINSISLKVGTN